MPCARRLGIATLVATLAVAPVRIQANKESAALASKGANDIFSLDHDQAIEDFREAVAADPEDIRAVRGLASALWLSITYKRGNMTVDDFIGSVSRRPVATNAPAPAVVAQFQENLDRALALARKQIAADPKNVEAHYQLGATVGLRASYVATVENSALGAFRSAKEAYNEHEKVLDLDPQRKDAALIVGTYRYIVAALAFPMRLMAYVAGFGGDKARGIRLIEEAAAFAGDNQTDARLALVLIYNREQRYDDALKQLAVLRERYPRNRLLWLESGSTSLRAGHGADAERFLSDGLARQADDARPRMFGEMALWYYKRGAARANLQHDADAAQDLARALTVEGRKWVYGRSHLELGKLALKGGRRDEARQHFNEAIALAQADNDPGTVEEARRLMR